MQNVLTLIVDPRGAALSERQAGAVRDALALTRAKVGPADWLDPGIACDIPFDNADLPAALAAARTALRTAAVDALVQPAQNRRKRILIADMESTIIRNEMLDELADLADLGPGIAEITSRAMNGELEFEAALKERVGLLKGLPGDLLEKAAARIKLMPGAVTLLRTLKKHDVHCALVSGGFEYFTGIVAAELGFDAHQANRLIVEDGVLAGTVMEPILGRDAKLAALQRVAMQRGAGPSDCLAVGDGANDLAMLEAAGLGIAFHAKPKVQAAARHNVRHGDLTALLYAQGYRKSEIVGRG